jgi:hypothetical protein
VGHNLDDVYGWVQKDKCDSSDEERGIKHYKRTKCRDEDMFVNRVASSCRSFNFQARLSHFLASDQRCISADPRRLANTFGLALKLLKYTLRCSAFLAELLEQLHNFPSRLIWTNQGTPHLLKMWSSFRCAHAPKNLTIQYYIHYSANKKIPGEKAWEEGCQHCILHYYGFCIAVAVMVLYNVVRDACLIFHTRTGH